MSHIQIALEVPKHINEGLQNGFFERVGGVVRETNSKEIVAWLRETSETTQSILPDLPAISSPLNLAISTMGFAVVINRLSIIEKQLETNNQQLESVGHKFDITFFANFRAAVDLAMNAFTLTDKENRNMSAMQAINRFLESEHHYTKLVDTEIENRSQVVDEYLSTLMLAYITEARCYLELEELDTARRRLQEGASVLRPRVQRYIEIMLTSNPAAYLHPALKGKTNLKRVTQIYQWLNPGTTESEFFDSQRENLFLLAENPKNWIETLPNAIQIPKKGKTGAFDLNSTKKLKEFIPTVAKGLSGKISSNNEPKRYDNSEYFDLLPEALSSMEMSVENKNRMDMYLAEVETIINSELTFYEWRKLSSEVTNHPNETGLIYISMAA